MNVSSPLQVAYPGSRTHDRDTVRKPPPYSNVTHCARSGAETGALFLSYTVYVVFIFLFVIVLMNFLNAIAIGDINKLRENTIAESNIRKIENLLDQEPDIQDTYIFQNVNKPPELQSELGRLFTNKVRWGCGRVLA